MPSSPVPSIRALVVDEAAPTRQRLGRMLSELDGVIAQTCGGRAADVLRRYPDWRPHCVVFDLPAHDPQGFELLGLLRKLNPGCLVVVLTDGESDEVRRHSRHLGADHVLDKSTEFERVVDLVCALGAPS